MRRAAIVNIHGDSGILSNQRSGGAGMVQMDVGQQYRIEIADRYI
jgi:hypothetical protein